MKAITHLYILLALPLLLLSCVDAEEYDNTCRDNMEALWKIMDEHYCFFTEKKEQLGVDWNDVHARYAANVNEKMTRTQLFEFLGNMANCATVTSTSPPLLTSPATGRGRKTMPPTSPTPCIAATSARTIRLPLVCITAYSTTT